MQIDERTQENIRKYIGKSYYDIYLRIKELEKEWDVERLTQMNLTVLAITGIGLSIFVNRKWITLTTLVLFFYAQHNIQGWSPPISLFRSMKARTRQEIDQEINALKALRGDFKKVETPESAFKAVKQL
ncbi:MAG: hypothetical protein HC906_13515 [Bacteroidales bacterium]|nr:hypothetical protein [Bacteroidales bacterium]